MLFLRPKVKKKSELLKFHFKNYHKIRISQSNASTFICKTDNCLRKFKTCKNLFVHIDKMHYLDKDNENNDDENESTSAHDDCIKSSWNPSKISLASEISEMIANLRLNTNITGTDFSRFIDSLEKIISNLILNVTEKNDDFLKYKNIDTSDSELKTFLNQFDVKTCFTEYTSIQGQINALQKKYQFINTKEITLGQQQTIIKDKDSGEDKPLITYDSFQYIPVIDTLQLLLSNKEVFEYVNASHDSSDDSILNSDRDSENLKKKSVFSKI